MEVNIDTINNWITTAYGINNKNGFHDGSYSDNHRLMMIVTEIGEAIEADRKRRHLDKKAFEIFEFLDKDFGKSQYWQERGFVNMFQNTVKDTFEDELADIVIRCCDFLGMKNLVFQDAFQRPIEFPSSFCNHFSEKGWNWVRMLNNPEFEVPTRVAGLMCEVLWYCEETCINIEKHVEWKMKYNQSRPPKHGKSY